MASENVMESESDRGYGLLSAYAGGVVDIEGMNGDDVMEEDFDAR